MTMSDFETTTWRDELENLIRNALGTVAPGGVMIRGKGAVFVDVISRVAYQVALKYNEQHGGDLAEQFANIFTYLLNETNIHELVHKFERRPKDRDKKEWERNVNRIASKLAREMTKADWMVWNLIPCPKKKADITFDECLKCSDAQKAPECPLWAIRQVLRPRPLEAHTYHVTELFNTRYAYYARTRSHGEFWDGSALDFWFGKAAHVYIQESFPQASREVFVWWNLGDVKIIGSIDAFDPVHQTLYEFKTYSTVKFQLQRNEPEPEHVFQVQTYVKLAEMSQPWLVPKEIKIIYMAKAKLPRPIITEKGKRIIPIPETEQRYLEFTLKPDPPKDLEARARELDLALTKRKPPNRPCTEWKCKGCHYREQCEKDGWK